MGRALPDRKPGGRRARCGVVACRLFAALLGLGYPGLADAAVVSMITDAPGCGTYATGVGTCTVSDGSIAVTWALAAPESLNGYDFEIRWDAGELTLTGATQLYPDTATPLAFLEEPSDPNDSRALVISLTPASTVSLFRLTFEAQPSAADGMADLWWFANGNGLAPGTVILENPSGAGIDMRAVPVPALNSPFRWVLAILMVALSPWLLASVRKSSAPDFF